MGIKVTFLGFNSAVPTVNSHPSAQIINANERYLLIDCGEGTQVQLRKAKIKFSKINHIFISHMHGDHVFGLIGLISTFHLLGRKQPLHIFGPKGIKSFINHQLSLTYSFNQYEIIFHELDSNDSELIYEGKKVEVYTIPLRHRVYCNGYLVKEKQKLKKLNIEEVKKYPEIKTCDYLKIKQGHNFLLSNKEIIENSKLTFPAEKSKSYAYCSDTMYSPEIIPIIENVDLLYHEATFLHELKELAVKTGHSTAKEAAQIAQKANVQKLILGHFSNRYLNFEILLNEAKSVFTNTALPNILETIEI